MSYYCTIILLLMRYDRYNAWQHVMCGHVLVEYGINMSKCRNVGCLLVR
jgi:hypothetical protein